MPCRAALGKECAVNILRRVPPRSADDNVAVLLVPFEHRAWAYAELFANLDGYGNLTLRGQP
jgi:hypothetical protein